MRVELFSPQGSFGSAVGAAVFAEEAGFDSCAGVQTSWEPQGADR